MYKFEARYINMETGDEMYLPIEIDLTSCGDASLIIAWNYALHKAHAACEQYQSLDSIQFICC